MAGLSPAGLQAPSRHQGPGGELGKRSPAPEAADRRPGPRALAAPPLPASAPAPRQDGGPSAMPPQPSGRLSRSPWWPPRACQAPSLPWTQELAPSCPPGSVRVPAPLPMVGRAAAFSGVLHPGHGLVSPLCSPQKLCPLAPVLGEHGRRSGSQPPQGGKRETPLTFPPSSEKGERAAWRSRAGPGRGGGSHVGRWSPTEHQLQTIGREALDSAFLTPGQVVPSCM